jgi:hypothetical protein
MMVVPDSITTLYQFQQHGQTITAYCSHYWVCSHQALLRMDVLAQRLGWQFDFFAGRELLAGRLYCSICGWYYPSFALGHAVRPRSFAGTHGAGHAPISVAEAADRQLQRQAAATEPLPWVGKRRGGRKFGRS